METYRVIYHTHGGRMNFNTPAINYNSVVAISASEYHNVAGNPRQRFLGDAVVVVAGIAPHGPPYDPNHGVEFSLLVYWPTAIDVLVDITVLGSEVVYESP